MEVKPTQFPNPSPPPTHELRRVKLTSISPSLHQYTQSLDEILFTNIDITGTVLGFQLINLSANSTFQTLLRSEFAQQHQHQHQHQQHNHP
ncbi:MAG: hypothetical protein Q9191_001189, partial [Dirinaria sp. TL-2023a]